MWRLVSLCWLARWPPHRLTPSVLFWVMLTSSGTGSAAAREAGKMLRRGTQREVNSVAPVSLQEKIELIKWHLGRYDRLRASTTNRAGVVLSAAAILSAGIAVIL